MLANNVFDIRTKININICKFNINKLDYIDNIDSHKIEHMKPHYKLPVILPKDFRFSIISIPKYTVVLLIKMLLLYLV